MSADRVLDMTTGIVAHRDHPLLARKITRADLARYPWIICDASPGPRFQPVPSTLAQMLARLSGQTSVRVPTIVHASTPNLLLMASGPYLALLSMNFLDRLPGRFLQPLPVEFGRSLNRTGFVVRRSAASLSPIRRFTAILRQVALRQRD